MAKRNEKPAIGRYASTDDRGQSTVLLGHVPFDDPQTVRMAIEALRAAKRVDRTRRLRPAEVAWIAAAVALLLGGTALGVRFDWPWNMAVGLGGYAAAFGVLIIARRVSPGEGRCEADAHLRRLMLRSGLCPSCCYRLPDRADQSGGTCCPECGAWWRREGDEHAARAHAP